MIISLIICSRYSDISISLKENIQETIYVEYELIIIDNSTNQYSIFEAYNEGVRRSRGDILCFMHDDILFHTNGWGIKVCQYFEDANIGLIGVVGTNFFPKAPANWFQSGILSGKLIQGMTEAGIYKSELVEHLDYIKSNISIEVVAVDGLWFCMPRSLFTKVSFDEKLFHGFHCYDIDICMQVLQQNYQVKVITDILIEHYSYGSIDDSFKKSVWQFYRKWKKRLPIEKGVLLEESDKIFIETKLKNSWRNERRNEIKLYSLLKRVYKKIFK